MIECARCGKCCVIWFKDKFIPCQYQDENHLCKIYETRLGTKLNNSYICNERKNTPYDYPNCPYNTNLPMHPAYR